MGQGAHSVLPTAAAKVPAAQSAHAWLAFAPPSMTPRVPFGHDQPQMACPGTLL